MKRRRQVNKKDLLSFVRKFEQAKKVYEDGHWNTEAINYIWKMVAAVLRYEVATVVIVHKAGEKYAQDNEQVEFPLFPENEVLKHWPYSCLRKLIIDKIVMANYRQLCGSICRAIQRKPKLFRTMHIPSKGSVTIADF